MRAASYGELVLERRVVACALTVWLVVSAQDKHTLQPTTHVLSMMVPEGEWSAPLM